MLTVNDIMTVNPYTLAPEMSLREIIRMMKEEGCRHLPVVDDGKLVGIVTDRDVRLVLNSPLVLHARWPDDDLLDEVAAEGIMTTDPVTVTPDTPAAKAAEILSIYKFGALPVVENHKSGSKTLVGIVTVTDFLNHFQEKRSEIVY